MPATWPGPTHDQKKPDSKHVAMLFEDGRYDKPIKGLRVNWDAGNITTSFIRPDISALCSHRPPLLHSGASRHSHGTQAFRLKE